MENEECSLLMCASNIIMMALDAEKTQAQQNVMSAWYDKKLMHINPKRSQVIHVAQDQEVRLGKVLKCGYHMLEYLNLGFIDHQHD